MLEYLLHKTDSRRKAEKLYSKKRSKYYWLLGKKFEIDKHT